MSTILIVDDEELVLSSLTRLLEDTYHVWTETGGRQAMARCAAGAPDLVLVDLYMPEMDGFEFIAAFRGIYPNVPIIAMSGGGGYGVVAPLHAAKHIVRRVLAKPFSRTLLLAAVRDALSTS